MSLTLNNFWCHHSHFHLNCIKEKITPLNQLNHTIEENSLCFFTWFSRLSLSVFHYTFSLIFSCHFFPKLLDYFLSLLLHPVTLSIFHFTFLSTFFLFLSPFSYFHSPLFHSTCSLYFIINFLCTYSFTSLSLFFLYPLPRLLSLLFFYPPSLLWKVSWQSGWESGVMSRGLLPQGEKNKLRKRGAKVEWRWSDIGGDKSRLRKWRIKVDWESGERY